MPSFDISRVLDTAGVQLEARALREFGAVVEQNAGGVLGQVFGALAPNILTQNPNPITGAPPREWNTTKYAAATASGKGGFDPKFKFLFKVHFDFYPAAAEMAKEVLGIDLRDVISRNIPHTIYSIDLPRYSFDYEDVNYYNFRTKVLRRIDHDALAMTLYDDVSNNAVNFFKAYQQLLQPISRSNTWDTPEQMQSYGLAFGREGPLDSSMRGVINNGANATSNGFTSSKINIIKRMYIDQYYLNRDGGNLTGVQVRQAVKVNSFVFTNPRLETFNYGSLSHEDTSFNMIEAAFNYDSMYMETGNIGEDVTLGGTGYMEVNDILSGERSSGSKGAVNSPGNAGAKLRPYVDILSGLGGAALENAAQDVLRRAGFDKIAGGALAGTINRVTGALGTATGRTLQTVGMGVATGIMAPRKPPVQDNSAGGDQEGQDPPVQ